MRVEHVTRRMVLGASPLWLALLPQSSQAQDVDLLSGLEPPISEIVKWAQTSKLKVVACTAIYQEAIDLRQAVLFNFAADGSTDIMSEPTLELLEAFHLYLATFAKNDGTRPRFVTVMFRDGGDYIYARFLWSVSRMRLRALFRRAASFAISKQCNTI